MKLEDFILSVINKVIVSSQLENGNSIDVSVKVTDKPLSIENREELDKKIQQSIVPALSETLYMRVRVTIDKKKDNWNKIKTIEELNNVLDKVFKQ